MARVIWKYQIPLRHESTIKMQSNAAVLSCQMQGGFITVWAMVDPDSETDDVDFVIYGTGHIISPNHDPFSYLASLQDGEMVWHVFMRTTEVEGEPHD